MTTLCDTRLHRRRLKAILVLLLGTFWLVLVTESFVAMSPLLVGGAEPRCRCVRQWKQQRHRKREGRRLTGHRLDHLCACRARSKEGALCRLVAMGVCRLMLGRRRLLLLQSGPQRLRPLPTKSRRSTTTGTILGRCSQVTAAILATRTPMTMASPDRKHHDHHHRQHGKTMMMTVTTTRKEAMFDADSKCGFVA